MSLFETAVRAISISPDGATVAVGDDSGEIALWDLPTNKVLKRWKGHAEGVRALQFSTDAATLVSGANDGLIRYWSVADGELQRNVQVIGKVEDARLSPNGKTIAVAFKESKVVQILDASNGKEIRRLQLPAAHALPGTNQCPRLVFSRDGSMLVTACGGRSWPKFIGGNATISIWETDNWSLRASFDADRFTISDLALSPDGRCLAGATNRGKTVKLWTIPPPAKKGKGDPATIARLIKRLESDKFADREVAQRELQEMGQAAEEAVTRAAESDSAELRFRARAILERLSPRSLEPSSVLPRSTFDVHAVAFSPDGEWLASGRQFDKPGNVVLYKLGDNPRRVIAPHQHGAWVAAFTPDGKQLLTGRRDGRVTSWSFEVSK
ncbi:MAG: hypothetical protein RIC55_17020 [Pirellulaceae bacterium]